MDYPVSGDANLLHPDPRDQKHYVFHATLLRRIITLVVRALIRLVVDLKVYGEENLPGSGPLILVANHINNFDVFPMQLAIKRPIFFMAKAELFRSPLLNLIFRQFGAFPVMRGEKDEWAMRHAMRVLEKSQVLGIFPEGSRSLGQGLRSARTGAARLSLAAHCPVVPMAVNGSQRLLKEFPRRARLSITIGKPIHPDDHESPLALTDHIMFSLASILPPDLRGVYAEHPKGF